MEVMEVEVLEVSNIAEGGDDRCDGCEGGGGGPDEDDPVLLREDGLVHLPPVGQVLQHETHLCESPSSANRKWKDF